MRPIRIIAAPFHAGAMHVRVGRGPGHLLTAGLIERLKTHGRPVALVEIGCVDEFEGEIGRSFEVKRRVAHAVGRARSAGEFPLVLAGNWQRERRSPRRSE